MVDIQGRDKSIVRFEDCLKYGRFVVIGGVIHAKVNVSCSNPTGPFSETAAIGSMFFFDNCRDLSVKRVSLDGNLNKMIIGGKYNYQGFQISYDGMIFTSCERVIVAGADVSGFGRDGIYICSNQIEPMRFSIEKSAFNFNGRHGMAWCGGNDLTVSNITFNYNGITRIASNMYSGLDIERESTLYCLQSSEASNGKFTKCSFIGNLFCGFITDQYYMSTNTFKFDQCTFQASEGADSYCSWQKSKAVTYTNCTFYGRVGPCYDASVTTWPPSGPDYRTKFINCMMYEEDKNFSYIQNPATTSGPGCEYFPNILEIDYIAGRVVFDHCVITVNCNGRVWLRGKSNAGCTSCPVYANAIDMIGCKIKSNGREVCANPSYSEPFTFHQINLNGAYTGVLAPSAKRPPGTGPYYWGPGTTWNGTFGYGTFSVPPFAPCLPLYTDPPVPHATICGQPVPAPIPACKDETKN